MLIRPLTKKFLKDALSLKELEEGTQLLSFSEILSHPCHDLEKLQALRAKLARREIARRDRYGAITRLRQLVGSLILDIRKDESGLERTEAEASACHSYRIGFGEAELFGGHVTMVTRGVDVNYQESCYAFYLPKMVTKTTLMEIMSVANDPGCQLLSEKIQKCIQARSSYELQNKLLNMVLELLPTKLLGDQACYQSCYSIDSGKMHEWLKPTVTAMLLARREEFCKLLQAPYQTDDQLIYRISREIGCLVTATIEEKFTRIALHEMSVAIAAKKKEIENNPELQAALHTKKQIAKTEVILEVLSDLQKTKKAIDAIVRAIEIDSMTEETLDDFKSQAYVLGRNASQHGVKLRKHYITPFKKKK